MKYVAILLLALAVFACKQKECMENTHGALPKRLGVNKAKFEPKDGQVLLFAGQELASVGGLEKYNDGYLDHYKKPAGWTMYTSLNPGSVSFGFEHKGLDGVWTTDDWGDGDYNMSLQLENPNFDNMILAIGLAMVNHEVAVANGEHDALVKKLGEFLKGLAPRPVFLRIGYEFDGHAWNHYEREAYIKAFKRIRDMYDAMGIDNVAYVWQSVGFVSNQEHLEAWYPGDDYVDWCAYSFFSRWKEDEMVEFARRHDKPVFIAEATPTISSETDKFDGNTKETVLSNPEQAEEAWKHWFTPFFTTIDNNPDVIKAVSYINCHWKSRPMWQVNPTFKRIDARLQSSPFIHQKWKEEVSKDKYIHSFEGLYSSLKH
jgi:hypothetical protein